jgi:ubiquitin carboxyl-terminal hydrolase 8
MSHPGIKVLLLDLRTREEFEREHIRGEPVVCLEPMVLRRDKSVVSRLGVRGTVR